MFSGVSNWFLQWASGVGPDPESPGFARIRIQPQPLAGLAWAKTSDDSVHGRIVSHWEQKANSLRLDITIPANTQATVYLPSSDVFRIKLGRHWFFAGRLPTCLRRVCPLGSRRRVSSARVYPSEPKG